MGILLSLLSLGFVPFSSITFGPNAGASRTEVNHTHSLVCPQRRGEFVLGVPQIAVFVRHQDYMGSLSRSSFALGVRLEMDFGFTGSRQDLSECAPSQLVFGAIG